jgi:hypothetical protein
MNCQDFEELLSAYADGELSRTQREFIEEHLSGCAHCREKLAGFRAAGRLLATLGEMPSVLDVKETTISKIRAADASVKSPKRWLRPVLVSAVALIILTLLLVTQPWVTKSPEALATSIVRNSPEVQAFFNDEQIEEAEVTTKVIGNEGDVLVVLVKTETRTAAAEVNLKKKIVTDIVRVGVPEFQPGDEQKALDIARADPGVQELLAQGGVFGEVRLAYSIDITQVTGPDGVARKEGTARPTAFLSVDLKGRAWSVAVDLDEAKVVGIGKPSTAMLVADWSHIAFTILNPLMALLGMLIVVGLALRNRLAGKTAGIASIVFGILALYGGLYAWPGGRGSQFLALAVPVLGLIMGIAAISMRATSRWLYISGVVLGFLALVLDSISMITYPDRDTWIVFVIAVVIVCIVAYALYDQIRKIPRRWWRPVLVAFTAVVVLVLAILQPWGSPLEPESVMAKVYTAIEGLQSYRLTYYGTITSESETTSSLMEVTFAAPDRYHIRTTNNDETDEFIIIGDIRYVVKGSFTGVSITVLSDSFSSVLSKQATLDLLDELTDLQTLPEETIDGVRCLHYLGKLDIEKRIEEMRHNIQEFNANSDAHTVTDKQMEEMFEQMRSIDVTHEIWIGKGDYLIRQIKTEQRGPADENGQLSVNMTMNYYDFNQPLTIEPPLDAEGNLLPGWRLDTSPSEEISLNCRTHFQVNGEDPAHQQIGAVVTVTNTAMEATASNVRVELRNSELIKASGETPWINAVPESPGPVNLERGQSETFQASWEANLSQIAGDKLDALLERTVIKIIYSTPEAGEATRMYTAGGAVYPSAVPPAGPPGK